MSGLAQEFGVLGGVGDAVLDCAVPVTVIRSLPSASIKGRVQAPVEKRFAADLSVQPLSSRELQLLPEGMRTQERVKAYGVVELKTAKTSECKIPDRFVYKGAEWQIDKVGDWSDVGCYYRYEAVRLSR